MNNINPKYYGSGGGGGGPETIRRCPFCGGKPELKLYHDKLEDAVTFLILCTGCDVMQTKPSYTAQDAIDKWNRRAET